MYSSLYQLYFCSTAQIIALGIIGAGGHWLGQHSAQAQIGINPFGTRASSLKTDPEKWFKAELPQNIRQTGRIALSSKIFTKLLWKT